MKIPTFKKLKKKFLSLSKSLLVFLLTAIWIFSGLPPIALVIETEIPLDIPEVEAAVSFTNLTQSSDTTDQATYTTASITPSSNCLQVALVANSTSNTATTPSLSGNGLTWVLATTSAISGTTARRVSAFRTMGGSPSSGEVTISFGGTTQSGAAWNIVEFCSVDTSGTNGSGAVVQVADNNTTSGASLSVPMANFGATNNAAVAGFFTSETGGINPKKSSLDAWEEIAEVNFTSPAVSLETQWRPATSTLAKIRWTSSATAGGVALEIKATTTANVILLWDTANGPTPTYDGWTCISCNPGEAFYKLFLEASTTYDGIAYGATSSTATTSAQEHVLTYQSRTSGSTDDGASGSSGSSNSANNHTHTWTTPTLSSDNILPPHKDLQLIQKVNPLTLPANIIAMFDSATSSMPTGWTDYSNMGGRFLRGNNSNGAGGATSHTATTSAAFTSSEGSGSQGTSSGSASASASHTHDIAAASATDSANNNPLYGTLTFGKLTATSSFLYPGMIAVFDQTPPSGWTTYSSSSAAIISGLIQGGATYGSTGGSATETHSHSNVTFTSGGPSTLGGSGSGAQTNAGNDHTHTATYSVSTITSYPPHKGVILGQKNIYFEQSAFRAFANANSADVGSALAALNTAATLSSSGSAFRLRMLMHVATGTISLNPAGASSRYFKLQFVGKGAGSCSSPSGGTPSDWTDVTSSTVIAYNDNAAVADGAALTANANDPTHGSATVVNERYEEANNFGASTTVASAQDGMWDFSLIDNSAPADTAYCFRIVESDATVLDTYSVYPQITTAAGSPTFTQQVYQWFLNQDNVQPGSSKAPQSRAITDVDNGNLNRLRIRILVSTANLSASGQDFILQYKTAGGGCSAAETWSTVGNATSSEIWRFYNNTTPSDGTALSSAVIGADVVGSYEEIVTFTNPNAINSSQTGEWDFPILNNGAAANTTYCFRVAKSSGTALDTYSVYPQVTTAVTSGARAGGSGSNAPSVTETILPSGGTDQSGGTSTESPPSPPPGSTGGGTGQGGGGETSRRITRNNFAAMDGIPSGLVTLLVFLSMALVILIAQSIPAGPGTPGKKQKGKSKRIS
jgi:hypothetical protein